MRRAALFAVLLAAATGGISCNSGDDVTLFEATLGPENEVPPRQSGASGVSRMTFDGTTVTMPDTPENQADYPQVYNQKPGLGFPIARLGALTSLSCGAVVNLGFCRYAGKGQGEVSLLRRLWDALRPGDVLLADR